MDNKFKFNMPVDVRCENGLSKKLSSLINEKNIFIISDPFLYKNGTAKLIGDSLEGSNVEYFYEIEPNPSCESVDKAAEKARSINAGCVIGIGGGSALDVSKIVSCLAADGGSIYDYYSGGNRSLSKRKVIIVAPLTVILPKFIGINGVFIAEAISNFIGGGACYITMWLTIGRKLQQKCKETV